MITRGTRLANVQLFCINCNSEIKDFTSRNQKFCSSKSGKICDKEFKKKVADATVGMNYKDAWRKRWAMYNVRLVNEKKKEYQKKYPERYSKATKKWRQNNQDKVQDKNQEYYLKHRDELRAKRKLRYQRNRSKEKEQNMLYKLKIKLAKMNKEQPMLLSPMAIEGRKNDS